MSSSPYIFDASSENFQQGVIDNSFKAPVLVDFWAEWCQPCKQLIPILESLAEEMQGQFVLAKVNSESQQALSQQYQIRSIPTVLIFKNGEMVEQFSGVQAKETVQKLILKYITTEADLLRQQAMEKIQQNDFATAKQILLEAEQSDPSHTTVQIDLAHIDAKDKQYDAVKQRLEKLSPEDQQKPEVISLLNKIELAMLSENAPPIDQLKAQLESSPDDHTSRFQLATQLINETQYEAGLQHLITLLQKDRDFQDGAARKTLLSTFSLLGEDHPLVAQYRRKMFSALH